MRAAALAALVLLSGCAGGLQGALSTQADAIVAAQPARFEFYGLQHSACLARPTYPEYTECMLPAVAVQSAADAYRQSLEAAQATYASAQMGVGGDIAGAVACAVAAAARLVTALETAHVPIPPEVAQIAAMIPEGVCRVR